jgi:hypothetical protein
MITATGHVATPVNHPQPRAAFIRLASLPFVLGRRLGGRIAGFAAAGQLGPREETEVGRWTGARV